MGKRQIPKRDNKYTVYEGAPAVKRWLTNLARGSPITAEVALRRLGKVCELLETTPHRLLKEAEGDPRGLQDSLEDLVTCLESEGNEVRNTSIPI